MLALGLGLMEAEGLNDGDAEGLGDMDAEGDGLIEAEGLALGEGEIEADGEGEMDLLGDADGLCEGLDTAGRPMRYFGMGHPYRSKSQQRWMGFHSRRRWWRRLKRFVGPDIGIS